MTDPVCDFIGLELKGSLFFKVLAYYYLEIRKSSDRPCFSDRIGESFQDISYRWRTLSWE